MNNLFLSKICIALFSIAILTTSCDNTEPAIPTKDYSTVLEDLTNKVIIYTYSELSNNANLLADATAVLKNSPTDANLTAAKNAWIATRKPWEQAEGFLFGPVDTEGIDPSLDSWPVNRVDLQSVLNSSDALTVSYVTSLEGTLKGFHTVEFLLWGAEGTKTIGDFTTREFEYLVATSKVLANDATRLETAWLSTGGNFAKNFTEAGKAGSIYISQKSVLEELANGILIIADEVGNGKIHDPLEQEDFTLEESQFSDNSKTDFADNIRSIQNIYWGINGEGLSKVVTDNNATLDSQIKTEIEKAIAAIEAIPGTFTAAIPANSPTRAAAENAQVKVRALQDIIESQLVPLISNL